MRRRPVPARPVALCLAAALGLGGLAGCSAEPPGPGPAATALAAGLARLDVRRVPFVGARPVAVQRRLAATTAGLGDVRPRVAVRSVSEPSDGRARAVLAVRWPFGPGPGWRYRTRVALVLRGSTWRVRWAPTALAPGLAPGDRLAARRLAPRRGEVTGDGGAVLVTDRPVRYVGIDKTRLAGADPATAARALARVVGVSAGPFAARVAAAGPQAFVQAVVLRAGDPALPSAGALAAVPGAVALEGSLPLAPTRDFARPVLGSVGEATAELVTQSKGRLRPGDLTGLSGLQRRYDVRLRGESGVVVTAVPASAAGSDSAAGSEAAGQRELYRAGPTPGSALATTLDPELQQSAEQVLADVRPASAIVAVRPSDGHVLAVASGPGGNGLSTATVGRFAPGSTFKVVTSLALLRAGLTPGSPVRCPSTETVDGRRFENYDDYPSSRLGRISLRTAVANSCNTAMIAQRDRAGQEALAQAAAGLGLGVDHDLGFPAYLGSVPAQAGSRTEHAASMIGQGKVEASPLAMAAVAASVARGRTVTPQLLAEPPESPDQPPHAVTPAEARALRGLMRAVVTEGSGAFLRGLPGPAVSAKTGTAEYGTDSPPRTHAWMIAIRGDLAVAVFVGDGPSGSGTAGPLLEAFLRKAGPAPGTRG